MRVIRIVLLLAFAVVLGVPANGMSMPATDDCTWSSRAVDQDGDCGNAARVSGCGLLCASGSAVSGEALYAVAEPPSLAACSQIAFPPAAHSRAPEPAPPKLATV